MGGEHRRPPNNRMKNREDELNEITQSTITVSSTGGSMFMLEERDDRFYSNTYRVLREHGYRVHEHLEGTMYVERAPNEHDLERRAEAEKERELGDR